MSRAMILSKGRGVSHCIVMLVSAMLSVAAADEPSSDTTFRERIVGTWTDEYQGKRTMIVRPDGTATMIVELQGWKARLYASRLQFEMLWEIHDGRLKKRTTGGEPAGKVRTILRMMGDRVEERILELTQERLLLLDPNGKRKYDWRRVKDPPPDKSANDLESSKS